MADREDKRRSGRARRDAINLSFARWLEPLQAYHDEFVKLTRQLDHLERGIDNVQQKNAQLKKRLAKYEPED